MLGLGLGNIPFISFNKVILDRLFCRFLVFKASNHSVILGIVHLGNFFIHNKREEMVGEFANLIARTEIGIKYYLIFLCTFPVLRVFFTVADEVSRICVAEAIDALLGIANHKQTLAAARYRHKQGILQRVVILILINKHLSIFFCEGFSYFGGHKVAFFIGLTYKLKCHMLGHIKGEVIFFNHLGAEALTVFNNKINERGDHSPLFFKKAVGFFFCFGKEFS